MDHDGRPGRERSVGQVDSVQELHDAAVMFDGTGPGGGWNLKGMAQEIHRLNLLLDHDNQRIIDLERRLEEMTLVKQAPSVSYLPRNRTSNG